MEQTVSRLIKIFRDFGGFPEDFIINSDTVLSDVGLNSVKFIKFIVWIENEFGLEFDDDDLDLGKFNTLNDLAIHIESRIS